MLWRKGFAKVILTVEFIYSPEEHRMEDYRVCSSAWLNINVSECSGVLESSFCLFFFGKNWRLQCSLDPMLCREGWVMYACSGFEMLEPVHKWQSSHISASYDERVSSDQHRYFESS